MEQGMNQVKAGTITGFEIKEMKDCGRVVVFSRAQQEPLIVAANKSALDKKAAVLDRKDRWHDADMMRVVVQKLNRPSFVPV